MKLPLPICKELGSGISIRRIQDLKTQIENINPDIVILRQSPKINLERLIEINRPKLIVADASNYKTTILLWKSICIKKKIPFHATVEKGFYSVN